MPQILHQSLAFILVIGVLVTIHELGHFLLAKWCGVGVLKFSVGFGPALFKFRKGETEYQIGLIPLGGFVRMIGDIPDGITGEQPTDDLVRGEPSDPPLSPEIEAIVKDRSRWFIEKNLFQRSAIVFAGPFFNYLLAVVLVWSVIFFYGLPRADGSKIGRVLEHSPAAAGGLKANDTIQAINGEPLTDWEKLQSSINGSEGRLLKFEVLRSEENRDSVLSLEVTPEKKEYQLPTGEMGTGYFIGITPGLVYEAYGSWSSLTKALDWVHFNIALTYKGIFGMLTGSIPIDSLAGPVFMFEEAGARAEQGLQSLLTFTAHLSISLAVLNLLPIPILDGGHLMFFLIEAILGPISMRKKELAQQCGMLLLLSLMVFALHNDITREESSAGLNWEKKSAQP